MSSPTSRTLELLRSQGYTAQVVEKWNPYAKIRQDLFGCIDIVGISRIRQEIVGVQATTTGNVSARRKKILSLPAAMEWILAGGILFVHGWAKRGPRGKRKVWTLVSVQINLSDFQFETSLNTPTRPQPRPK